MILLQFKGDVIKGTSQVEGHKDWITVDSIQLGVGRSISTTGRGGDRDTSNPSFSEITISRATDKASPIIFGQAVHGVSLGEAIIHFLQVGEKDKTRIYLEYVLSEPIVSSYSVSSGGDRPTETFSITFTKIKEKYTEFFQGGKTGEQTEFGWDLALNQTWA
jgi:type VI secretion system secreted protein Hcp